MTTGLDVELTALTDNKEYLGKSLEVENVKVTLTPITFKGRGKGVGL